MLEVENLSRTYGSFPALDGVSLTLSEGDFLVVVGPNGAGKTTLVRLLARLTRPTGGTIRFDGEEWGGADAARQREVGVVSHSTFLYDDLTALENLVFYARMYGLDEPEMSARAALADAGLELLSDRRAGTLSRGQAQRVSIARAALHAPRLLLLDEPFAGLDPHAAARLAAALGALRAGRRAIILTTHDLARVPDGATHFAVLVAGRVVDQGAWSSLDAGTLEARYARAVGAIGGLR